MNLVKTLENWLRKPPSERTGQQGVQSALARDDIDTWARLCLDANRELSPDPNPWQAWQYAVEAGGSLRERVAIGRRVKDIYKSRSKTNGYQIGQEIVTYYSNAPVAPEQQYTVGSIAPIQENGQVVARFRVMETNSVTIKGEVVWVR